MWRRCRCCPRLIRHTCPDEFEVNRGTEQLYCADCIATAKRQTTLDDFSTWDRFPGYESFLIMRNNRLFMAAIQYKPMKYPIHPLAAAFPPMSPEEYAETKESISLHGLRHPIVLFEDMVLDGRNRQDICFDLQIPPLYRQFDPLADGEPVEFVSDENLNRRQLTTSQRAAVAAELAPYYADLIARRKAAADEEAKRKKAEKAARKAEAAAEAEKPFVPATETLSEKMIRIHKLETGSSVLDGCIAAAVGQGLDENPHKNSHPKHDLWKEGWQIETARQIATDDNEDVPEAVNVTEFPTGQTAAGMAAAVTGVSERSVAEAAALQKKSPEQFNAVKSGEKSINQAKQDAAAAGESISPYRAECSDLLEASFGEEFSQAIRNVTILKNSMELDTFMKQGADRQKEIVPFITAGWKVGDAIKFLKGEFTVGSTASELISYLNAKAVAEISVIINGFKFVVSKVVEESEAAPQ